MNNTNLFGKVTPPQGLSGVEGPGGIGSLINVGLNILVIVAGIYALFNLVIAGYGFMSAGDDPKKVASSWQKIWQTLMGLAFAAGAFILAAIFGKILFGDYGALLNPVIPTLK